MESIEHFICRQDQSNEEPLFIRPQLGVFHLLGFIKPIQHFNPNVFLYQIRALYAIRFTVVDCGHIDLGFMVHLKQLLHITWHF